MTQFVIASFVVYRTTKLLVRDDGPFGFFRNIRVSVGELTDVLKCFHCASVWVGFGLGVATRGIDGNDWMVYGLAYSGLAILIDAVVEYCRVQATVMSE